MSHALAGERGRLLVLSAVAVMVMASGARLCAQDAAVEQPPAPAAGEAPKFDPIEALVKLGPGVQKIKKAPNGAITSLVVIGQSKISTVLGKARGLETARRNAELSARGAFTKWLKTESSIIELSEQEGVILAENDGSGLTESGKAVDKNSTKMESVSSGLTRGLQLLHATQDPETEMCTVIFGWKADTAKGTKAVAALQADDAGGGGKPGSGLSSTSGGGGARTGGGGGNPTYKKDSATSEDAEEFLK